MDANIEALDIRPGELVVFDPTGRDLTSCLEVGRVTNVQDNGEGQRATVAVLGRNVSVWNVERIWARIPEDPTDG